MARGCGRRAPPTGPAAGPDRASIAVRGRAGGLRRRRTRGLRAPARRRARGGDSGRLRRDPGLLVPARRPPGGIDLVDHVEELPRVGEVRGRLDLRDLLVRVPEELVEVGDLLEVLGL